MLNLPILRWGQPYTSLEQDTVAHFLTGETLAKVSQANTGLLGRDMKHARRAREVLTAMPISELIEMMKTAPKPNPQITDEQWTEAKKDTTAEAYNNIGLANLVRKKYDAAAAAFKNAVDANSSPEPAYMVRLASAL